MRAEELNGHLDALLLAALEGGPRHGYAVIEALRQDTGGRLELLTGTIYPALRPVLGAVYTVGCGGRCRGRGRQGGHRRSPRPPGCTRSDRTRPERRRGKPRRAAPARRSYGTGEPISAARLASAWGRIR